MDRNPIIVKITLFYEAGDLKRNPFTCMGVLIDPQRPPEVYSDPSWSSIVGFLVMIGLIWNLLTVERNRVSDQRPTPEVEDPASPEKIPMERTIPRGRDSSPGETKPIQSQKPSSEMSEFAEYQVNLLKGFWLLDKVQNDAYDYFNVDRCIVQMDGHLPIWANSTSIAHDPPPNTEKMTFVKCWLTSKTACMFINDKAVEVALLSHPSLNVSYMLFTEAMRLGIDVDISALSDDCTTTREKFDEIGIIGCITDVKVKCNDNVTLLVDFLILMDNYDKVPSDKPIGLGSEVFSNHNFFMVYREAGVEVYVPKEPISIMTKNSECNLYLEVRYKHGKDMKQTGLYLSGRRKNELEQQFIWDNNISGLSTCCVPGQCNPNGLTIRTDDYSGKLVCTKGLEVKDNIPYCKGSMTLGTDFMCTNGTMVDYHRNIVYFVTNAQQKEYLSVYVEDDLESPD